MPAERRPNITRIIKLLPVWILIVCSIATVRAEHAPPDDTLRVGISSSFYPFNYLNEHGVISGFNVDVVNALCEQMQRQCRFSVMPFPEIIPALETRQIQLAASNLLRTPERAQRINFSDKYYRSTTSLVGHNRYSDRDPQQILNNAENRVAVTAQSAQWRYLNQHSNVQIVSRKSIGKALNALKQGDADYLILPTLFALDFLEQSENLQLDFVGLPIDHPTLTGDVHLGITKKAPQLQQDVNRALEQLVSTGELRQLINQYFPFNVY